MTNRILPIFKIVGVRVKKGIAWEPTLANWVEYWINNPKGTQALKSCEATRLYKKLAQSVVKVRGFEASNDAGRGFSVTTGGWGIVGTLLTPRTTRRSPELESSETECGM